MGRSMSRLVFLLGLALAPPVLVSGCGAMVMGERGVEGAASDFQLQTQVAQALMIANRCCRRGSPQPFIRGVSC